MHALLTVFRALLTVFAPGSPELSGNALTWDTLLQLCSEAAQLGASFRNHLGDSMRFAQLILVFWLVMTLECFACGKPGLADSRAVSAHQQHCKKYKAFGRESAKLEKASRKKRKARAQENKAKVPRREGKDAEVERNTLRESINEVRIERTAYQASCL